jgi:4,5-dihydroxyphthalate decarboxylase
MELLKSLFGSDWWPYGVEPNRHLLETLLRYMGEQGLVDRPVKLEELFAPNIAGEFKI